MAKLTKTMVDLSTGVTEVLEMTPDEVVEFEATQNEQILVKQAELANASAKTALLNRLGITAEEATLLLS
jgi:hypothetical protein